MLVNHKIHLPIQRMRRLRHKRLAQGSGGVSVDRVVVEVAEVGVHGSQVTHQVGYALVAALGTFLGAEATLSLVVSEVPEEEGAVV
jgi:hypothetical protein